jgi:hypothetical protein
VFQQMSVLADEVRGTREDVRQGRTENSGSGFEDVQSNLDDIETEPCASLS